MQKIGLGECELSEVHIEVPSPHDSDMFKARLDLPLSFYADLRRKFDVAGILLYANAGNMHAKFTDDMIEKVFLTTRAMGLPGFDLHQDQHGAADRSLCPEYKMIIGYHNHDHSENPDEFATAEGIERALEGASHYSQINLDIGHFTAANQDAVAFLRKHHARIMTIHIKTASGSRSQHPIGMGDTPIIEVLRLMRDNHWNSPPTSSTNMRATPPDSIPLPKSRILRILPQGA